MSTIYLELRARARNAPASRRFADDPRSNENWIARGLRLMGIIA
jgi:hypothetical protein